MACDRKLGPFDCCSVVQGDCLELMKQLPDGCVDAVITDPPYGIGFAAQPTDYQRAKGWKPKDWDNETVNLVELFRVSHSQVIWGGNYYNLPPKRGWLVWHKPDAPPSMADCELAWTSRDANSELISQSIAATNAERVGHPTQKPLRVMLWTIERTKAEGTILDPFAGSGTTLVAAKKLGRHFLGFEISPEYCQIARDRLARIDAQPNLFVEPKPEQMTL